MRKPSPVRMYCSRMALNSSCPAVSRTREELGHSGAVLDPVGVTIDCRTPQATVSQSQLSFQEDSSRLRGCFSVRIYLDHFSLWSRWTTTLWPKDKPHEVTDQFSQAPLEDPGAGLGFLV